MAKRKGANKENLEETRKIFLQAGLEEFCVYGYANASTSRIVTESNMARGSLYYHFGDKQGLFIAIYEDMMYNAIGKVGKLMEAENDAWSSFIVGTREFLKLCTDAKFRKIVLIESQSAIAFEKRIEMHEKTFLGKLRTILSELFKQGYFKNYSIETLSVIIFGMLAEIGRALHYVPDTISALNAFEKSFVLAMENMAKNQ